jgi:carboxyl-terminal processing protease
VRVREADLGRRLSNPQEKEAPGSAKEEPARNGAAKPAEEPKSEAPSDIVSKSDYQLNEAVNLLKALNIVTRK